jgi:hypothetical protein
MRHLKLTHFMVTHKEEHPPRYRKPSRDDPLPGAEVIAVPTRYSTTPKRMPTHQPEIRRYRMTTLPSTPQNVTRLFASLRSRFEPSRGEQKLPSFGSSATLEGA